MITIAVCNNKGGTGKTKTTQYLARALCGERTDGQVGVMDLDGQANLTDAMLGTLPGGRPELTMASVLTQKASLSEIIKWPSSLIPVFPADGMLDDVADDLITQPLGVLRLKGALERDRLCLPSLLLIDCPPNLGALTYSALIAADYVIIPAVPQAWAINGVRRVCEKVAEIGAMLGKAPQILGTVATMVRPTAEHATGLEALSAVDMPRLLGKVAMRGGLTAHQDLLGAYLPVSEDVQDLFEGAI